ncbi:ubiquitin carboxyl-terminal hydrolase 12-like [Amborella trichopoda]|uniref:ubiquitin carboxyl-terminal hydrolase 12-like n=1 Tax=Amborella trichopoda TaxID=13333 RepID=UPI0005D3B877|nr:ubiquitin carboxyl-terminal hydrolase 12-like [Amborella trichopoda]|eukprot:XP_011626328.1 ubiquitin carboxyl-terminal hydrolase 12-like [Amborella trichopoda]
MSLYRSSTSGLQRRLSILRMLSPLDGKETQNSSSQTVKVVELSADNKTCRVTWKIENFTSLNTEQHYSDIFIVGGCKWQLSLFPKGNNVNYLSVYLNVPDDASLPNGWSRYVDICFCITNQTNSKDTKRQETQSVFAGESRSWGFSSFIRLSDLGPKSGYMINGTIIMEVEVSVRDVIHYSTNSTESETVSKSEMELELKPQDKGTELDDNNAELKNKIKAYEQELAMKDEEAKYKEMVIARKDGEIAKIDGENKELRAALRLLEMMVEDMQAVTTRLRSHSYLSNFTSKERSPTSIGCSEDPIESIGKESQDP